MTAPLEVRHIDAAFMLLGDALAPSSESTRADLVDLLEKHADWVDDQAWIPVETVADLILDNDELAALLRAATPSN